MNTPKPRNRIWIVVLVVVVLAAAGAYVYYQYFRPGLAVTAALAASGTMETTNVSISPEVGGRVVAVNFKEGDTVKAGDVLVTFDTALLEGQRQQAQAALAAAQANYNSLQSGATAAQLQAALAAAQANYNSLQNGATAAQLQAAVSQAQMQVLAAQQAITDLTDKAALASAQANQAVAVAQSALTQANKDLRNAQNPAGQALFDTVDHTKLALTTAQNGDLLSTVSPDSQALVQATAQVNILFSHYQDQQAKWDAGDHSDTRHTLLQNAQSAYQTALDTKTQLELRIQTDKANRDQSVIDAQKAYTDAVNNLASAQRGPDVDKLALAQANAKLAQAALADAQAHAAKLGSGPDPELLALAQARLATAQASLQAARAALAPAQLDAAKAAVDSARAALAPAQLDAAKAAVDSARAALNLLDVQLGKLTVVAPSDGVVLSRAVEPGEVASPGATLMVIGPLTNLQVTVYVPEDRYGQIRLGQMARLSVDSFPGRVFEGKVLQIANQAEFTPRNTQTVSGRKDTVFAVKLGVANPDLSLKPGMAADVSFQQ
jgi:HlyD family secretion protein